MTYRAGIIGCGSIAGAHARGYQGVPGIDLVAVADPVDRVRTAFQERFSVPAAYVNAEDMLRDEHLDLVSICLWHPLHAEFTQLAARYRPKAVLCEKPMATCLAEADAMIEACDDAEAKLVIGHQRRFNKSWTRARALLAEGAIGTPEMVEVQTGEGLLNCGTHVVDAIRYMLGDPEGDWVMGAVERCTDRWERSTRIEDCCMGLVRFRTGTQALIQCDLAATANVENYAIRGSEGLLQVEQRQLRLLRGGAAGWETIDTGYDDCWIEQAKEVVAWIEGGPEHRGSGRTARGTLELLMAVYQSARTHGVVRLPLQERTNPLECMVEEGALPVRQEGRYDIREFLTFEPADRERYESLRKQGLHPREILERMGKT
jgi:UDP-N-acetyl-2-amino-2-deoxyglucuronate dehydrogenase